MREQTITQNICDVWGDPYGKQVPITIKANHGGIEIYAEGYGVQNMEPGSGAILFLEFYDGKLSLYAYGDINKEDPTHKVDFAGAREDRRGIEETYKGNTGFNNFEQMQAAQEWVLDNIDGDYFVEADGNDCPSPETVAAAIEKHYEGGVNAFVKDYPL